jgi:hypothetical protein
MMTSTHCHTGEGQAIRGSLSTPAEPNQAQAVKQEIERGGTFAHHRLWTLTSPIPRYSPKLERVAHDAESG